MDMAVNAMAPVGMTGCMPSAKGRAPRDRAAGHAARSRVAVVCGEEPEA